MRAAAPIVIPPFPEHLLHEVIVATLAGVVSTVVAGVAAGVAAAVSAFMVERWLSATQRRNRP